MPSQSGAIVMYEFRSAPVSVAGNETSIARPGRVNGPSSLMYDGSSAVTNAASFSAHVLDVAMNEPLRRPCTATRAIPGCTGLPAAASSCSTMRRTLTCGPTVSGTSDCGGVATGVPVAASASRTCVALVNGWPVSRATCSATAAAAATSGADAEVPPVMAVATALYVRPLRNSDCTPSPGAETLTRLPKPLENPSAPLKRVSANAGALASAPDAGSSGLAEKMSSSVDAPTSIAPLSGTTDGAVVR